jgi:adenine C2-methylase RlmN of 23S rRNA A2503 and tRNA A37
VLKEANYTAIIRKSKGQDISAACGQLYAEIEVTCSLANSLNLK